MDVLYLTAQRSRTATALMDAATRAGVTAVILGAQSDVIEGQPHLYGGPGFCAWARTFLAVSPIEPSDDWLPRLPWSSRRRDIRLTTLGEARLDLPPSFVKAPREKDFEAGIYSSETLPRGGDERLLLVSDIVSFVREYRLLVLDGKVVTGSRYMSSGQLDVRPLAEDADGSEVRNFAQGVIDQEGESLPSAVTLDVGWAEDAQRGEGGWAVVEANMAWFSNIYDCDADEALRVVMRAAGPTSRLRDRDRRFVR